MKMSSYLDFRLVISSLLALEIFSALELFHFLWFKKGLFSEDLIHQGPEFICFDDILLMSHFKSNVHQLNKQTNDVTLEEHLRITPEKTFPMLLNVKKVHR